MKCGEHQTVGFSLDTISSTVRAVARFDAHIHTTKFPEKRQATLYSILQVGTKVAHFPANLENPLSETAKI